MAKKTKKPSSGRLGRLVVQAVLIVFSVLLALFLDNIRSYQKTRVDLKAAYRGIRSELESNVKNLVPAAAYHGRAADRIDSLLRGGEAARASNTFYETYQSVLPGGAGLPSIHRSAWNTFTATGLAAKVRFGDVYAFSMLYALQAEGVEQTKREIEQFLVQPERFENRNNATGLKTLAHLLRQLHHQEIRLRDETEKALGDADNWPYLED